MSVYDDKPPEPFADFVFTNTGKGASMTGRTLWRVWCARCGEVVHEGSTGARYHAERHIRECTGE